MRKVVCLLLCLMLFVMVPTWAYQVQPMIVEMQSAGKNSLVTYRLQNPADSPLPVEVEVYKRTFDENLQEVLVPAEKDFVVLPPQIEVPANGYQVFRAKYLGKPDLTQTESYRIVFKQLPLEDEKEKAQSGVKMMFNFATLVFVTPEGVSYTAQSQLNCPNYDSCKLTIANKGKKVLDLAHFDFAFSFKGAEANTGSSTESKKLSWTQFQPITKGRFIMPNHFVELDLTGLRLQEMTDGKAVTDLQMVSIFANATP